MTEKITIYEFLTEKSQFDEFFMEKKVTILRIFRCFLGELGKMSFGILKWGEVVSKTFWTKIDFQHSVDQSRSTT